jgi:zinc transport system substrate-binding protein
VRTDQGVTLKTREDAHDGHDGHDGHDKHGDHDEHEHGQSDPHVWLSPLLARQMSQTVLSNLQTVMPQQAELFARNHAAWDADLLKLHTDIQAMFTDLARKQFMIFHPSWGYFADAYDLQQISIEAYGKEPGPRSLARLIDFARAEKIAAIFVQKQFSRRAAQSIAEAVGAVLIEVDPLAENYLDNMRKAARLFAGQ